MKIYGKEKIGEQVLRLVQEGRGIEGPLSTLPLLRPLFICSSDEIEPLGTIGLNASLLLCAAIQGASAPENQQGAAATL